ncbi:kelch-like protein 36 isoform X2 [Clavelina lepadiformis]|uniref:kelch-like protein 36 isoform X2 n=1 Tax=Clavelina lepadiformis TaxID=159417 RepID=UPI00404185A1
MLSDKVKTLCDEISTEKIVFERKEAKSLLEYANRKRLSGKFNDVIINIEDESISANKMVLSCFSDYFGNMFDIEMKEKRENQVEIRGFAATAMKLIVEFIYTGNIEINKENVCDLLSASNMMQIDDVKEFCFEFLEDSISIETCLTISYLADLYGSDHLEDQVKTFIEENIDDVITTENFKNLSKKELVSLSRKVKTQLSEIALYKAVVNWTKHNREERQDYFQSLFQTVDLTMISSNFVEDVVSCETLVQENFKCLKTLVDGFVGRAKKERIKAKGTRILSLGGTYIPRKVTEVFNILQEPCMTYPDLNLGRTSLCSVLLHGCVYAIGGEILKDKGKDDSTNSVSRLNLNTEELKWEAVAPMRLKRMVMGATVLGDLIFVVGESNDERSSEYYTPTTNKWTTMSPMKQGRHGNSLVACEGFLYAIGGQGDGLLFDFFDHLKSVERYQPRKDEWNDVAPMTTARTWFASVAVGGFIYATGGESKEGTTEKSVEKYDVTANKWTRVSDMNYARSYHSACVMQGKIYVVGGSDVCCTTQDRRDTAEVAKCDNLLTAQDDFCIPNHRRNP